MSLRGLVEIELNLLKWSWWYFPLRQFLQCVTILGVLLSALEVSRKDKAKWWILSLGWSSLWCHSSHLFVLLMLKAKWDGYEAVIAEVCVKEACFGWSLE